MIVMKQFWVLAAGGYNVDFSGVFDLAPFLVSGIKITLLVAAGSFTLAVALGLFVAVARVAGPRLIDQFLTIYVDIGRSVPDIVIIFLTFFLLPVAIGTDVDPVQAGIVALGFGSGAAFSELFRGGIYSLDRGQWLAGRAIGMSTPQLYRRVILPQAIVRMLPPLGSQTISLMKATALVSLIGVADLMWQGEAVTMWMSRRFETYTVVAVLYFLLTTPIAVLFNIMHSKLRVE
jgi:His/Glu/Gln/Arg/opine family amino acid ABC transporter permease subunit